MGGMVQPAIETKHFPEKDPLKTEGKTAGIFGGLQKIKWKNDIKNINEQAKTTVEKYDKMKEAQNAYSKAKQEYDKDINENTTKERMTALYRLAQARYNFFFDMERLLLDKEASGKFEGCVTNKNGIALDMLKEYNDYAKEVNQPPRMKLPEQERKTEDANKFI